MESTQNFQSGFERAYRELKAEGRTTEQDDRAVKAMLSGPFTSRSGERVYPMRRLHRRTRRYYTMKTGAAWNISIDWESIIQWIKDNWMEILKLMLTLLFLFAI